jgi:hypothetical protein
VAAPAAVVAKSAHRPRRLPAPQVPRGRKSARAHRGNAAHRTGRVPHTAIITTVSGVRQRSSSSGMGRREPRPTAD